MHSTLFELVGHYIDHLLRTGHRLEQVVSARRQLDYFLAWAENERLDSIYQFDADHPALYLSHLKGNRDLISFGPIGTKTQRERLTKLRRFLEWLHREGHIETDLARAVPKLDRRGNQAMQPAPTTKTLSPC